MRTLSLFIAALVAASFAGCNCGEPPGSGSNQPPLVRIVAPEDGTTLTGPGPWTLTAEASDPEDGALGDAAIAWSSDLDGALGSGASLQVRLRGGTHRLSVDVTDSGGLTARAQISVVVSSQNREPSVTIEAPEDGAFFDEGEPITLRGRATDDEDGALSGAALSWHSDVGGAIGTGNEVTFTGAALGKHRLMLTAVDSSGASGRASVTIEVLRPGSNRPPQVRIQSPANNQQVVFGSTLTLQGSATDTEDGALTGASLAWSSSLDGALGTGESLTVSTLQLGVHTLTLTATDSEGLTGTAQVTIAVNAPNNAAPTAQITAPQTGFTAFQGAPITFTGSASDPEDGPLTGASLAWSSTIDGPLGTGSPLTTSALAVGGHQIRLTATDSKGSAGVDTIQITVLAPNGAPSVTISAPQNGATFNAGTLVALRGSAVDPEDGPLTGASLTWRSNLEGILGTGASLDTSSLRVGAHQLTLTATDSGGQTASAQVNVTIQSAPVKLAPVARLTGPVQGETGQTLTFDGSTSSDSDGTIASWRFDFGDGSTPVSGTSQTAQHAFATAGSFTVTLTVTDNDGLTASASVAVEITQAVRRPEILEQRSERLGSTCRIGAAAGALQVAFRSLDHPALWFGVKQGAAWTTELVDGMGFNTGGEVAARFAMAVDAAGNPHFAYALSGRGVWYATRSQGVWIRERVDVSITAYANDAVSIALDPANGGRPTVVYENYLGSYLRTTVAVRTGPATWSNTSVNFASSSGTHHRLNGDVTFSSSGTLYIPYLHGSSAQAAYLGSWDGTTASHLNLNPGGTGGGFGTWASAAWRSANQLLLITGSGLLEVTLTSPHAASTFQLSLVEPFDTRQQGVTSIGSTPHVVVNHGSELELVHANAEGYWMRESLGATDDATIGVTSDGAGNLRACFFRAGKLMLY